jgi:hypothetical protein
VCTLEQAGGSEDLNSLALGNHDEILGVQEISINYISSGELFDRNTMVVDSCFSIMVVDFLNDHNPKTMTECTQCWDWIKWKEAIKSELGSLGKREVFSNVIPTPPRIHPIGFKWGFIQK